MRRSATTLLAFGVAVLASAPRLAHATPTFPAEIQAHESLKTAPACTVCHTAPAGGAGTATEPFAMAMKQRGLLDGDVASVDTALDKMATDKVDSDGDGVTDVDELKAGTDPNTKGGGAGGGGTTVDPIAYGCGAQVAPGDAGVPWLAATAVGLGLLAVRRRRAGS